MPGALEPFQRSSLPTLDRRTAAAVEQIARRSALSQIQVQADASLAQARIRGVGHTAREVESEVVLTHLLAVAHANGDPILFDRLSGIEAVAAVLMQEQLIHLGQWYCQGGF